MFQVRTVQRCPRSAIDATLQVLLMPPCPWEGADGLERDFGRIVGTVLVP